MNIKPKAKSIVFLLQILNNHKNHTGTFNTSNSEMSGTLLQDKKRSVSIVSIYFIKTLLKNLHN
jgi:hypothetical protein